MARHTMNVSLTPQLESFVSDKVSSGRFQSASEVVRAGLRMLEESEADRKASLQLMRRQIAEGVDQLDRGQVVDGEEVFREIEKLSHARRRKLRKSKR
jgi:antitoxin ParD1/3/4